MNDAIVALAVGAPILFTVAALLAGAMFKAAEAERENAAHHADLITAGGQRDHA